MKKVLLGTALLALTFGACTKKESTVVPPPAVDTVYIDTSKPPVDTSVIIAGISDLRIMNWNSAFLSVTAMRTSGLEQKVTMTVSGLPRNAKAEWSAMSGYTTFNTNLTIMANFVKSGTYPLVIASMTEKGKTKDYNVNLVVDSLTKKECNVALISRINSQLVTVDSTLDSTVSINTVLNYETVNTQLYLRNVVLRFNNDPTENFYSYSATSVYHVKLMFDCETGTLTIPEQDIRGRSQSGAFRMFKISGSGKVNIETGTYDILYTTEYQDAGTNIIKSYLLKGQLI